MQHMNPSDFDRNGSVLPHALDKWRRVCDEIDAMIETQRIRQEVERRRERDDDASDTEA